MKQPYILSIVIPVYNRAQLLTRCVDSIIRQSTDVEIVLVDDCSLDNSAEVCAELATKLKNNVVFVQLNKNSGPGIARNEGIKVANGKFLYFLDSDDEIENLEPLLQLLKENPDADIVCSNITTVHTDGFFYKTNHKFAQTKLLDAEVWFRSDEHCGVHALMFRTMRTDFIRDNEIYYPGMMRSEDVMFTLNALLTANRILVTPLHIYRYFLDSPNSLVSSSKNNAESTFNETNMILSYVKTKIALSDSSAVRAFLQRTFDTFAFVNITSTAPEILYEENDNITGVYFKRLHSRLQELGDLREIYFCPGSIFNLEIALKLKAFANLSINGFLDNMEPTCINAKRILNSGFELYKPDYAKGRGFVVVLFSISHAIEIALIDQFAELGYTDEYSDGVYFLSEDEPVSI